MSLVTRLSRWLEARWVTPAYSGLILSGLSVFFFAAATNTMAGWLYVMSAILLALLGVAAVLPRKTLEPLQVSRRAIAPVMAGEPLTVEVQVLNTSARPRELVSMCDRVPHKLGPSPEIAVEVLRPGLPYVWTYSLPALRRGIYRWSTVQLRTASPLGLFWSRSDRRSTTRAVVYPQILELSRCPLLDKTGQQQSPQMLSQQRSYQTNDGLTRALRPYRWGDSTRLIHWRTSARYGELRVRELEILTSGETVVIALDTAIAWEEEPFEQAAIATASLYTYALRQRLGASLWTPDYGSVHGEQAVLEVLAGVTPQQGAMEALPSATSVIWLTQNSHRLAMVGPRWRWVLWPENAGAAVRPSLAQGNGRGLVIRMEDDLRSQLSESEMAVSQEL